MSNKLFPTIIAALASAVLTLSACAPAAGQNEGAQSQSKKEEKKEEKKEAMQQGTPVFWQEPTDIASRNLLLGPGGEEMKPDLKQVIWEESLQEGYSVKWRVRDVSGRHWVVKLGNEAQPETVATRLVWAAGYPTEVNYLVPCVQITNAPKPPKNKSVKRCEGKGFANVRFEARPDNYKRLDGWSWTKNPFSGTKEFAGFVVLMGLLNNWDLKDTNNKVVYVPGDNGGELRYIVSDLGATFGKTGGPITHSRNEPEKYIKTGFLDKVEGNYVKFDYHGKNGGLFDGVTVEQAKWMGDLLSQLSEEQIKDAFRAANYTPKEVEGLAQEVLGRINALHSLPAPATASTPTP
jgi:ribosomal protein L12E/L44/L45/RPP1/RPP2